MTTSDQIEELMLRWEEARGQGVDLSASALCAQCPQLIAEVRERIRAVEEMEHVLGVRELDPRRTHRDGPPQPSRPEPLPRIPGYELLRIVGEGGMGVVYEAVQLELGRTVAVKMILGPRLGAKLVARFKAEAEAAARIVHPNVLQIYEVGQVNERPFFSMEFVHGETLGERITRQPLTVRGAAELVETLARAVHVAHGAGVVHRDLKPGNVMLTADGVPKIADFGLAKRLNDDSGHTQTGEILGTPAYMAPEQAEGKRDVGPPADVYALGAILYELLTGRPPFQGTTPLDCLRLVTTQEPIPPARLNPAVPGDLEAICLKCLEKSPTQRYPSALALAADLRNFLVGAPVVARRIGLVGRAWRWGRRHPVETALAVVLLGLACVPVAYLVASYQAERAVRHRAEQQAPLARAILQRHCAECHDGGTLAGKRTFDALKRTDLLDAARGIVVPGDPAHSRLIRRTAVDGSMPPEEEEQRLPRLTERELVILTDWIRGGAPAFPPEDAAHPTPPVEPAAPLAAQVKAIFIARCYECHNYKAAKGGIKILYHRLLVNDRKVVLPGRPDESELYQLLVEPHNERRMPPDEPLPADEIATIRRWIAEGAPAFTKDD